MSDNKHELLRISRQLSPEHQEDLLSLVHLAFKAETSARKSSGLDVKTDVLSFNTQDCSCENSIKGRKK